MKIEGSVALVTGGASGLGEAALRRLVSQGAKAVIIDRDAERGETVASELGTDVHFVQTDVTRAQDVQAAVDVAKSLGELRIAVNCAGIGTAGRTLNRQLVPHDLDVFRRVIEINLIGTFNVLRLSASAMAGYDANDDDERGVIINTASIAAYEGQIGQAAYAASKGGIVALSLPTARDLSSVGVRVNAIAPGTFDTPMLATVPDPIRQALAAGVPFPKRLGNPEYYGLLVEQIVRNPYLNGECIRLDGALRMAPK